MYNSCLLFSCEELLCDKLCTGHGIILPKMQYWVPFGIVLFHTLGCHIILSFLKLAIRLITTIQSTKMSSGQQSCLLSDPELSSQLSEISRTAAQGGIKTTVSNTRLSLVIETTTPRTEQNLRSWSLRTGLGMPEESELSWDSA